MKAAVATTDRKIATRRPQYAAVRRTAIRKVKATVVGLAGNIVHSRTVAATINTAQPYLARVLPADFTPELYAERQ